LSLIKPISFESRIIYGFLESSHFCKDTFVCRTLADFFCRRTADFLSGSNRFKICRAISLLHTRRAFIATNRVDAWGRVIQNQDGVYSTDVSLKTFPNWLRRARAPTNCLDTPHTSRQGRTRRLRSSTVRYRPTSPDLVADLSEFTTH